jgi:hypothetical protein
MGMMMAGAKFRSRAPTTFATNPTFKERLPMNIHASLITAAVVCVFAIIFSIIDSFAFFFGLDLPTAASVCKNLFFVLSAAFIAFKWTSLSMKIIPAATALGFLSLRPAFKYWAYGTENSFYYNYQIGRAAPWYANDWIQFGVVFAILVFGYFLIWMTHD